MDSGSEPKRLRFFFWIAAACLVLTIAGFTLTYFAPLSGGKLGAFSPTVHIHGILFFLWMLLLLAQTWLVSKKHIALHRSFGLVGISLATAMVIFGFSVSLGANMERMLAGQEERAYALGFSNAFALIAFAILVSVAIFKRRRPESHKRLMIFATIMLLNPPVGRLYRPLFAPSAPEPWLVFATIDTILFACILYDLKSTRRLHPVTITSGLALITFQVIRFPVPRMQWWRDTYDVLLQVVQ